VNVVVNVAATLAALGLLIGVCYAIDGIIRMIWGAPYEGRHRDPAGARTRWRDHPTAVRVSGWIGMFAAMDRQDEAYASYADNLTAQPSGVRVVRGQR